MTKTARAAFSLLFLACTAEAQSLPQGDAMLLTTAPSRTLLAEARTDLLYLRVDAAEEKLRRLAARPDGAPAAYHHLATASLLRGFLTDDVANFTQFAVRSDSVKALLKSVPASRWSVYLEAEADFQRAIVWGRLETFTKAALAARSAQQGLKKAAAGSDGFVEPLKGLGLMHMVLGSLPSGYRRLLQVLGYSGTVAQGRRELVRAATQSQYNQEEARLLLALSDVVVRSDAESAIEIMDPLYQRHPRSPLVAHVYGYSLLSSGQVDRAARVYAPVVDARAAGQLPLSYAVFYYADARFKQNRFDDAARLYTKYLSMHRGPSLRAAAQLGAALSLEMLGRREEALPLYRQIRHTRTSETEEMAVRIARERLAQPMSSAQKSLLRAANALAANRPEEAARLVAPLDAEDMDAQTAARRDFLTARASHVQGKLNEAIVAYGVVIADPGPDPLDGFKPWSHYYTGEIYAQRGQKAAARQHFEAALAQPGHFDRYLSLEQYVRSALEGVR